MEEQKISHTSNIKLTKSVSGTYGWEIRIANDDLNKVVKEIKRINDLMLIDYPNKKRGSKE